MINFSNYELPLSYNGIIEEHLHCRNSCSVFDVSHMGQLRIHGADRIEFVESLVVSDIKELKTGSSALTVLTNEAGGIIDISIVTNLKDFTNLVINSMCVEKDIKS